MVEIESRVPSILAGSITPQVISSVFVAGRFYTKARLTRSWGWDDSFLAIAYAATLIQTILQCVATRYGSGLHSYDLEPAWAGPRDKLGYVQRFMYHTALATTKWSICLFYLHIFQGRRRRKWLSIGTMVFVALYFVLSIILNVLECIPPRAVWDQSIENAKCMEGRYPIFIFAGLNIAVDIWLIALFLPRVWALSLPPRQKVPLLFVVSLGWVVVVAAVIRIVEIARSFKPDSDETWEAYAIVVWSAGECNVGLFCVAAPSCNQIVRRIAPKLLRFSGSLTRDTGSRFGGFRGDVYSERRGRGRPIELITSTDVLPQAAAADGRSSDTTIDCFAEEANNADPETVQNPDEKGPLKKTMFAFEGSNLCNG